MTDPIADMLTRIRNSLAVNKSEVVLPFSKMKLGLAEILKKEGYIKDVEVIKGGTNKNYNEIRIVLKYKKPKKPAISGLKSISKPGRRIYATHDKLPKVLNDLGIAIISTSQGLMTNKEARKRKLGGEVVCEIY
jgi:small subunit ribosomal protein S8